MSAKKESYKIGKDPVVLLKKKKQAYWSADTTSLILPGLCADADRPGLTQTPAGLGNECSVGGTDRMDLPHWRVRVRNTKDVCV